MIKVLVCGAAGKMGQAVVAAVAGADSLELVALVDTRFALTTPAPVDIFAHLRFGDLSTAALETSPDVIVDFTHPDSVEANIRFAMTNGIDCVVGTTGLTEGQLAALASKSTSGACLFMAPNFAIGAVLMMRLAAEVARFLPHVEIIELHHDRKADAPSGTALRTASLIHDARGTTPDSPGKDTELVEGARGAYVSEIPIHSVRLPGLVAHQEVIFGGQGQTLTIRHDSIDRTSFMPGVLLAIHKVGRLSGLVIGLERLMGD